MKKRIEITRQRIWKEEHTLRKRQKQVLQSIAKIDRLKIEMDELRELNKTETNKTK